MSGRRRWFWGAALLALLVHLRGLANGFVYDDFRFVVENDGVHTLARPWEFFTRLERMSLPADHDIWRPLRTLLFALEHAVFGDAAWGYHAVSLLLFLLLVRGTAELAARLIDSESRRGAPLVAAGAALLFGVHPLTVESVAWVSSQGDLLAALLVVTALLCAKQRPGLAFAATAGALLAKESALPLVVLFGALTVTGPEALRPERRTAWRLTGAVALLTVAFLLIRQRVIGHSLDFSAGGFSQREAALGERLLQACQCLALTLERAVWPRPLSIDYDATLLGMPGTSDVVLTVAAIGALLWLVVRRRRMERRETSNTTSDSASALSFGAALLFLLPTSGLLVAMKSPSAERFLLLPLLFLVLGSAVEVAEVVQRNQRMQRLAGAIAVALSVAFSPLTIGRTGDFADDPTLWRAELAVHPASIQANFGLLHAAAESMAPGDRAVIAGHARAVIEATPPGDPRRLAALFRLGEAAFDAGDRTVGTAAMEQARAEITARGHSDDLDPALHLLYVALGNVLRVEQGPAAIEALADEGVARFGRQPRLLELLGVARDQQGASAEAETLYQEALAAGPPSPSLCHHLALALDHLGRRKEALLQLEKALALDPSHVSSRRLREEWSR